MKSQSSECLPSERFRSRSKISITPEDSSSLLNGAVGGSAKTCRVVLRDLDQFTAARIEFLDARETGLVARIFLQDEVAITVNRHVVEHLIGTGFPSSN
jgi:hypothetical protein